MEYQCSYIENDHRANYIEGHFLGMVGQVLDAVDAYTTLVDTICPFLATTVNSTKSVLEKC